MRTDPELVRQERDLMRRLAELDGEIADLSDERAVVQGDLYAVRDEIEEERKHRGSDETWLFFHPEEAARGE